jgi:hypothetical protein
MLLDRAVGRIDDKLLSILLNSSVRSRMMAVRWSSIPDCESPTRSRPEQL